MRLQQYPAVEPHWPYGTVGYIYMKTTDGEKDMGIRELVIQEAVKTNAGWFIRAGLQTHQFSPSDETYSFEVGENGEAAQCVPWDDDLEEQFNPRVGPFAEAPGTKPVRFSEPSASDVAEPTVVDGQPAWDVYDPETDVTTVERFEPEAGWTVRPPAVRAQDVMDEDAKEVAPNGHR